MTELLYASNTPGTATATAGTTDATIYTANIKPNQYNAVKISATIEIVSTGTNTANNKIIKLKAADGTVKKTLNYKSEATVTRTLEYNLEWVGDLSQGGATTITIADATAADAGVTFKVLHLYCHSIA